MRFLATLLALNATITSAAVTPIKKDVSGVIHAPRLDGDITNTTARPIVAARDGPPFALNPLPSVGGPRWANVYESSSNHCSTDLKPTTYLGGNESEGMQTICYDFDTSTVGGFSVNSSYGCQPFIQNGSCETGGTYKWVGVQENCTLPFDEAGAPTTQSLLVVCGLGDSHRRDVDITDTASPSIVAARQESPFPPHDTDSIRYANVFQYDFQYCLGTGNPIQVVGGNDGDDLAARCFDIDSSETMQAYDVDSTRGCDVFFQESTCEVGGPLQLLPSPNTCVNPPLLPPTAQSLLVVCGLDETLMHGRDERLSLASRAFDQSERYVKVWRSMTGDCNPESSHLFTIDGGKWGSKPYSSCHPFTTSNIKSFAIQAEHGCQTYIHQGSCETETSLHMVDCEGTCTPVPPSVVQDWSLEIICNGGMPERYPHEISRRGEHAVSTAQADPRWIKYWITGNDQCQVSADDSGTIYSGNMGDNFSEACQTRPAFSGDTWIYVSDSHGCDLYMEVGPCESIGSFPAFVAQGQCTQVPPEWVNSVWSLRAICSG